MILTSFIKTFYKINAISSTIDDFYIKQPNKKKQFDAVLKYEKAPFREPTIRELLTST